MTDFRDELLSEFLFAATEHDGFFTLYLADGTKLCARPIGCSYGAKKYGAPRLVLLTPDGRTRGLSTNQLDGFALPNEGMVKEHTDI